MTVEHHDHRAFGAAAIATAALACLQPGIDPVFLTLLSSAHLLDPANHGWIVGATQSGMALGAVIAWRSGERLPRHSVLFAALLAAVAALVTLQATSIWTLMATRMAYGAAMGLIYTQTMSSAAAVRPTSAYGMVFLTQLILSTVVALLLPAVERYMSAATAVSLLIAVPLIIAALSPSTSTMRSAAPMSHAVETTTEPTGIPTAAWALLGATFWFICTTMIVWSFAGALAIGAGISDTTIGNAVAIGSVIGAVTAIVVARDRARMPLTLCGPLAGMGLLAPLLMTHPDQDIAFILSIALLNIGSTAMLIRCSGAASERGGTALFRRMVAASHSLGMIAGPVIGAAMTLALGQQGLAIGALFAVTAGCVALFVAASADNAPNAVRPFNRAVRALSRNGPYS